MEILEALTPVMSVTVMVLSLLWEQLWVTLPRSSYFESLWQTGVSMALILAGAILAFLLVWTEYRMIKETSALTFMIAGTCREMLTGERVVPVGLPETQTLTDLLGTSLCHFCSAPGRAHHGRSVRGHQRGWPHDCHRRRNFVQPPQTAEG